MSVSVAVTVSRPTPDARRISKTVSENIPSVFGIEVHDENCSYMKARSIRRVML